MDGDYETVSGTYETESTVKGSRFIAVVQRCPDADSIREALEGISARYPNATHYCYAAVFGGRSRGERFSDNGEPSGTAGRPILSVLRGSGLSDTICVVVRYFGGTLLGTGGLVQAYTDSASSVLGTCGRSRMMYCRTYRADLSYDMHSRLVPRLKGITLGEPEFEYSDRVGCMFRVREDDAERFERLFSDVTGGSVVPRHLGNGYAEIRL